MSKLKAWSEDLLTDCKELLSQPARRHERIRFRPTSEDGKPLDPYIEITPTEDGGLEIRVSDGILNIEPVAANSVIIYQKIP